MEIQGQRLIICDLFKTLSLIERTGNTNNDHFENETWFKSRQLYHHVMKFFFYTLTLINGFEEEKIYRKRSQQVRNNKET